MAGDAATAIEAAFFDNGVETLNVKESIADAQAAQKALFNLLIGFMSLGLLVGIAALGVISARAVVERRHGIGVLRAIGFSPGMVQLSFLVETSYLAILGIGLGPGAGSDLLRRTHRRDAFGRAGGGVRAAVAEGDSHFRGSVHLLGPHHDLARAPGSRNRARGSSLLRVVPAASVFRFPPP